MRLRIHYQITVSEKHYNIIAWH